MPTRPSTEDVRRLSAAQDLETVLRIVRTAARRIARSDGATFVLRDGDHCFYADEDAVAPLWKGQRFPMTECLSGWAMLHGRPAVVADIEKDARVPLASYRPTFVRSMLMVPIGVPAVGAIGAYWCETGAPSPEALEGVLGLARLTDDALTRVGLDEAPWAPNFGLDRSRA